MCSPKSKGGKRCLHHHPASNAVVTYTEIKTGVDRTNVYQILKTLNKEGRKLDNPSIVEVNKFLEQESFKARHDQDLNESERRRILKNLDKAKELVKETGEISGGNFHAWKNTMKETIKKVKTPLMAAGLAGVLAVSVSACAPAGDKPIDTPAKDDKVTVAPLESSVAVLGDKFSDQYGEYTRIKIDPKFNAAETLDSTGGISWETFETRGIDKETANKAINDHASYSVEQVLDSINIDTTDKIDVERLDKTGYYETSKFVDPETGESTIEDSPSDIFQGKQLRRDGSARFDEVGLAMQVATTAEFDNSDTGERVVGIYVKSATTSTVKMDDEFLANLAAKANNKTKEQIIDEIPWLNDGKDNYLTVYIENETVHSPLNEYKITGLLHKYTVEIKEKKDSKETNQITSTFTNE